MNDAVRWLTEPVNWVLALVMFMLGGLIANRQRDRDDGPVE